MTPVNTGQPGLRATGPAAMFHVERAFAVGSVTESRGPRWPLPTPNRHSLCRIGCRQAGHSGMRETKAQRLRPWAGPVANRYVLERSLGNESQGHAPATRNRLVDQAARSPGMPPIKLIGFELRPIDPALDQAPTNDLWAQAWGSALRAGRVNRTTLFLQRSSLRHLDCQARRQVAWVV